MSPRGLLLLHVGMRFWGIITESLNRDVRQPNCFIFRAPGQEGRAQKLLVGTVRKYLTPAPIMGVHCPWAKITPYMAAPRHPALKESMLMAWRVRQSELLHKSASLHLPSIPVHVSSLGHALQRIFILPSPHWIWERAAWQKARQCKAPVLQGR